ncbi:MAG: L-2-amino-thiazoline-4-carboxylic acid hydrolase [Candidatus Thorarchaeota archaeon]
MRKGEEESEISHLQVRRLQAPLVSSLIKEFAKELGTDKAYEITQRVINKDAILSGESLAREYSGNSLKIMMKIVQEVWAKDSALTIEKIELNETSLKFDVTKCGYAEMYKRLGFQELGHLMSCSRDFAFMDGFNPDIELRRSKTIMEGDAICNFCYVLKK